MARKKTTSNKRLKVLVARGGEWHPFAACTRILKDFLERSGVAECTVVGRDEAFTSSLASYDCVVLYTQGGKLSAARERNLCAYLKAGGGLVGIHCASDSFTENPKYLNALGTRFAAHGPGTPNFPVSPVAGTAHPLAKRLKQFRITDEFYLCEPRGKGHEVFLDAYFQGGREPTAYTKNHGKGRVFYTALGHDERAFRHPAFQNLLTRGVLWAGGGWREERPAPFRFGLLGYGPAFKMGKHHAENMRKSDALKAVAVCDLDPRAVAQAQEDLPGIRGYRDIKKMLADNEVEGVVVILPHNLHYRAVLQCLRAGRHVVVEKPFCFTAAEADRLIATAAERGLMLSVYQSRRWDGHYLTMKKLVESGEIGTVFEAQLDFGAYAFPGEWWRSETKTSGGLLYDWGAHCFDYNLTILRDKRIVGVAGYTPKQRTQTVRGKKTVLNRVWFNVTNEDHFRVVVRFADGSSFTFRNSQITAGLGRGWTMHGTLGTIHFPNAFDKEATVFRFEDGRKTTKTVPGEKGDWADYYLNIADHLHNGLPLFCRPEQSARVVAVIETALKSAAAGRELPFNDKYFGL